MNNLVSNDTEMVEGSLTVGDVNQIKQILSDSSRDDLVKKFTDTLEARKDIKEYLLENNNNKELLSLSETKSVIKILNENEHPELAKNLVESLGLVEELKPLPSKEQGLMQQFQDQAYIPTTSQIIDQNINGVGEVIVGTKVDVPSNNVVNMPIITSLPKVEVGLEQSVRI